MVAADDGFVSLLTRQARAAPSRLYARFNGASIAFADVDRMSSTLARRLRRQGLAPGDRVAVMLRNGPVSLALLFGLGKAGAVWVPINVQSRGENLGYIFNHAAPKLVIAESELLAIALDSGANFAAAQMVAVEAVQGIAKHGSPTTWSEKPPGADDTFAVMYYPIVANDF